VVDVVGANAVNTDLAVVPVTNAAGGSSNVAASAPTDINGVVLRRPSSTSRLLSAAASVNATVVKASPGALFKIQGTNANAAKRYLKLYDKATAPASTDTPVMTLELAASAAFSFDFQHHWFATGIGYRITTAAADNDTGALTAGDILCMNVSYA
jgi:hypothetical protein